MHIIKKIFGIVLCVVALSVDVKIAVPPTSFLERVINYMTLTLPVGTLKVVAILLGLVSVMMSLWTQVCNHIQNR